MLGADAIIKCLEEEGVKYGTFLQQYLKFSD